MHEIIDSLKQYELFNNTAWNYLLGVVIFFGSLVVLKIFQIFILRKLKKIAQKTQTQADDVLIDIFQNIKPPFYLLFSLFLALRYFNLSALANKVFFVLLVIVIFYEIVRAFQRLIDFFVDRYVEQSDKQERNINQTRAMMKILKGFVVAGMWVVAVLIILSNLGVNVTSLVASLGIGGIAIALALQNVLSDIFSSFSIFIDKPFKVDDFIIIGADSGTVEKIGLKTTRLRTRRGEELIVSNKELTTVRVQNMRRLKKRRDDFILSISEKTPKVKLEKIPEIIEQIIKSQDHTEFERCCFSVFGPYGLDFEVVFFVDSNDFNLYTKIKHAINLEIVDKFKKEGIEIKFPAQSVLFNK